MTILEYRQLTIRTLPDLGRVLKDKVKETFDAVPTGATDGEVFQLGISLGDNANKLNYTHMVMGLAGEIGELVQCVGTELKSNVDKVNLGEELGDIYWYLANYANMRELDIPEEPAQDVDEVECLDLLIIKISDLVDIVKKFLAYNKPIEKGAESVAVYDIRLALLLVEKTYGLDGAEIRKKNIAKLLKRFPEKFDDYLATHRDLDAERKELEQ